MSKTKKYLSAYLELVKEWHPTKNGDATPDDFTFGSHQKVHWLCPKGHAYTAAVKERTRAKPTGCPYCTGSKVGNDNNFAAKFPRITKQWHPTKNGDAKPEDFTFGSNQKVFWLCPQGHTYEAAIKERTRENGTACPYCW